MHEAVMRKYPEDPEQAALPEELRDGTVPPAVLEVMHQSWQKPRGQFYDKNATPAPLPKPFDEAFDDQRPHAILEERSGRNVEDVNQVRGAALAKYSNLKVKTGSALIDQWETEYLPSVFPFALPRCVGGADYWPKKRRWRRHFADAPEVSPFELTRSLPRRVEGQMRGVGAWYHRCGICNSTGACSLSRRCAMSAGYTCRGPVMTTLLSSSMQHSPCTTNCGTVSLRQRKNADGYLVI